MESRTDSSDTEQLLAGDDTRWRRMSALKWFLIVLLGIAALTTAVLLGYFLQFNHGNLQGKKLKIMALNTWGMPAWLTNWSKDKAVRIKAIGEMLKDEDYDVYLLEELWMRPDHATIKSLIPKGESKSFESPAGEGVVSWSVKVNDFVLEGDIICTVETEAANETVTSQVNGYVEELIVAEGDVVTPGTYLVKILVGKYHMTEVGQLAASSICDGRVLPTDCSGLAIVSRFPILEHEFHTYDYRGDIWWLDGEYLARKGVGRVRVEPYRDMIVDVFVTHTAAEDYNRYYREKQVNQLLGLVQRSDADFVILGGDFNVDPRMKESSFLDIEQIMINSIDEFFKKIALWLNPKRATYGNPNNTYSNNYSPVTYDYIFHKANKQNMIWTDFFDVPFLKTFNHLAGKNHTLCTNLSEISLSDHEAVTSHLVLWKYTFQPSNKTDGDSDQA